MLIIRSKIHLYINTLKKVLIVYELSIAYSKMFRYTQDDMGFNLHCHPEPFDRLRIN